MIYFARDIKKSRNFFLGDSELMLCAGDILMHPEFYSVGSHTSHKYESRQKHLLNVAYYALKFSRPFKKLDKKVILRAALLHDFYPYQRLKKYTKYKDHVKQHPIEALKHAQEFFEIGDKEKDIIVHHMWPWDRGRPRYKESVPVMLADNFAAIMENFYHRAWQKPKRGVKKAAVKVKKAGKTRIEHARINHEVRKVVRQVKKANKNESK